MFKSFSPDWRLLVTAATSKADLNKAETEITVWELSNGPVKKETRAKPKAGGK